METVRRSGSVRGLKLAISVVLAMGAVLTCPASVLAHWCDTIYETFGRIMVMPECQTINVGVGETGELKVKVRNNLPYTMYYIKLRANNPTGLTVTVDPTETQAEQLRIYAGQDAQFTLQITRNQAGSDDISALNLEVMLRVESVSRFWRTMSDNWLDQNPTAQEIRQKLQFNPEQTRALNWARLAEVDCPDCESEGVQELMSLWSSLDGDFNNNWGQEYARAGQALAIRLRFHEFNSPTRPQVVQTMIDNMDSSFSVSRGLAAFYAAYGGDDPGVSARIQTMADSDSSNSARRMAKAALLMLGHDYTSDVTACVNDGSETLRARQACAAALGVMGEDNPVTNFLLQNVTDSYYNDSYGSTEGGHRLSGSYLLQLAIHARRGGPNGAGVVSFLDEAVIADDIPPKAPTGLDVQPL